jgi:hypothetical protein
MATETKNNVHEGKWGFYPCDYQMYQKIRRLYGYYLLALRRVAEIERWKRKQPQNRVIRRRLRNANNQRCGYEIVGPRPEPCAVPIFTEKTKLRSWSGIDLGESIGVINSDIAQNYRSARYPKTTPEEVVPLTLNEAQVDSMLAVLDSWKTA